MAGVDHTKMLPIYPCTYHYWILGNPLKRNQKINDSRFIHQKRGLSQKFLFVTKLYWPLCHILSQNSQNVIKCHRISDKQVLSQNVTMSQGIHSLQLVSFTQRGLQNYFNVFGVGCWEQETNEDMSHILKTVTYHNIPHGLQLQLPSQLRHTGMKLSTTDLSV